MSRYVFPKSPLLTIAACAALVAVASPSSAGVGAGQSPVTFDTAIASTAVSAAGLAVPSLGFADQGILELARHGADDPVGDDRGGKRGGGKGRGGHDDGPNHT